MKIRDIKVVAGFEVRRLVKSPHGIVFLACFACFYIWVAIKVYQASDALGHVSGSLGILENPIFALVGWLTDLAPEALRDMLGDHAPALVAFFFLSLWLTPLLSMVGACDQTASDIGSRHLRYLLLRSDRTSIYVGKVVGTTIFLALTFLASTLLIGVLALFAGGAGATSVGEALLYLLRIWLSLVLFSLPFVALMAFANALVANAVLAVLLGVGLQFLLWLVGAVGSWTSSPLANVSWAFPTKFKYQWLSDQAGDLLLVLGHTAGFAVLFFVAGLLVLRVRDV